MLQALALAGLSAGGSLLSSIGAGQASAKQGRLQMIEDNMARLRNDEKLAGINLERTKLGRELLDVETSSYTGTAQSSTSSTRGDVDVDKMMADAERAGFNPATFLNAGALQFYARSWADSFVNTQQWDTQKGHNAAEAFKMMLPEYALSGPSQVPQQSNMLQGLGAALTAGTNAFGTQLRADQSYDLQLAKLLGAQAMQGMGLSDGNGFSQVIRSGGSPVAPAIAGLTAGGVRSPSSNETDAYWPAYEQFPQQLWEVKKPEVTNVFPPSWGWKMPPGWANAESWEDSFGEPVSWPYGVAKFADTVAYNITGNTIPGHISQAVNTVPRGPISGFLRGDVKLPGFFGSHEGGYFPFAGSN